MANREAEHPVHFDELYRELILDHYRSPRNQGDLANATAAAAGMNPSCGDELHLGILFADNTVQDIRFVGQGCSISQASSSMMTEQIRGRSVDAVYAIADKIQQMLTDDAFDVDADAVEIGDLEALQGVARFPVRVKCALLAWKVLAQALAEATGSEAADDTDIQTRVIQPAKH